MRKPPEYRMALMLALLLATGACGTAADEPAAKAEESHEGEEHAEEGHEEEEGEIELSAEQIRNAGIEIGQPRIGGSAGTITIPAIIAGDPQSTQVVSAALGGRVVSLNGNVGQRVARGDVLAIVESREAAELSGNVEAARARLGLANSVLAREERLFAERVTPEQDLIAARTAATESRIALRQAEQSLRAAGTTAGALNRIAIRAPISGHIIARPATLGQTVSADAELFRVANLAQVSVEFSLDAADAGRVAPGTVLAISAPGRQGSGRVTFISPALDETTRLVPAIATVRNAQGNWRIGEAVQIALELPASGDRAVTIPQIAVQTVEGQAVAFVATEHGFRVVPVRLGGRSGDWVVVLDGLTGTERIATTGSFTLKAEIGKGEAEHEH